MADCLMMYSDLDQVYSLDLTKHWFAQGCYNGILILRDLEQGAIKHSLTAHNGYIRSLAAISSPETGAETLLSASQDGTLKLWDPESARCLQTMEGHNCAVDCVSANAESKRACSGDVQGCIAVWDLRSSTQSKYLRKLRVHVGRVMGCVMSRDGRRVSTASDDGTVKYIDTETSLVVAHYNVQSPQMCVATLPDEGAEQGRGMMVSGGSDGKVYSFDTRVKCAHGVYSGGHTDVIVAVGTLSSGRVFSAGDDGVTCQWSVATGGLEHSYHGHSKGITCMKITKDGHLFTGSYDGTVRHWDNLGVIYRLTTNALFIEQQKNEKKKKEKKKK